jgi:lipoate-protein ligase A
MLTIKHWDLTLPSPAENLACDEALLDHFEEAGGSGVLRFWEPAQAFVVVGYSNRVSTEVDVGYCRQAGIPILRRCSGGGTVLQGRGCLCYSLVLRIEDSADLQSIHSTNRYILERNRASIENLVHAPLELKGHTDLAMRGLKFSGNAQRRKRHCLLFHGGFLLDFDLSLIEQALPMPSQQPNYRANRSHEDFLVNLGASPTQLKAALRGTWNATEELPEKPYDRIESLVGEKYGIESWNLKF